MTTTFGGHSRPASRTPNPQAHISNLWRTTTDVAATTDKVRINLDLNDKWAELAGAIPWTLFFILGSKSQNLACFAAACR